MGVNFYNIVKRLKSYFSFYFRLYYSACICVHVDSDCNWNPAGWRRNRNLDWKKFIFRFIRSGYIPCGNLLLYHNDHYSGIWRYISVKSTRKSFLYFAADHRSFRILLCNQYFLFNCLKLKLLKCKIQSTSWDYWPNQIEV